MGRSQHSLTKESHQGEQSGAALDAAIPAASKKCPPDTERPESIGETTERERLSGRESVAALWRNHRPKVLVSAAALAALVAGATLLTTGLPEQPGPGAAPHTVAVTYTVTGDGPATITYKGGRAGEARERKQSVELPWTKELRVDPADGKARVSIVLGRDGGRAQCTVAVAGQHRQRATAFGDFGRASCSARIPPKSVGRR